MKTQGAVFFLAANSANGFFSLFNELYDYENGWRAFIIKGGPGTGKSGLMKKVAKAAENNGYDVERILCSSDPDSLDAIIIPQKKICFADGTAPHVIEPKYPGSVEEILNLGQFWNSQKLYKNREHIKTVTDCNKALHNRSSHYITAASSSMNDSSKIIKPFISQQKIVNYASRFIIRNCKRSEHQATEKKRFITGITPDGYVTLFDTAKNLCEQIYTVTDENQCISGALLQEIRNAAISNGINIITCLNPLDPDGLPLHIILPDEKIGIFTSNSLQNFKPISNKNINVKRFLSCDIISTHKKRLAFNRKLTADLINESVKLLKNAKQTHDNLESYYIESMDFGKLNDFSENIIKSII